MTTPTSPIRDRSYPRSDSGPMRHRGTTGCAVCSSESAVTHIRKAIFCSLLLMSLVCSNRQVTAPVHNTPLNLVSRFSTHVRQNLCGLAVRKHPNHSSQYTCDDDDTPTCFVYLRVRHTRGAAWPWRAIANPTTSNRGQAVFTGRGPFSSMRMFPRADTASMLPGNALLGYTPRVMSLVNIHSLPHVDSQQKTSGRSTPGMVCLMSCTLVETWTQLSSVSCGALQLLLL